MRSASLYRSRFVVAGGSASVAVAKSTAARTLTRWSRVAVLDLIAVAALMRRVARLKYVASSCWRRIVGDVPPRVKVPLTSPGDSRPSGSAPPAPSNAWSVAWMRARISLVHCSGWELQYPCDSGSRVGGTAVIVVWADAVTGAYWQPPASVNVSLAALAIETPARERRLGRAVYSIVCGPEAPDTVPRLQVIVVVPAASRTTELGRGPAPRSSAVL